MSTRALDLLKKVTPQLVAGRWRKPAISPLRIAQWIRSDDPEKRAMGLEIKEIRESHIAENKEVRPPRPPKGHMRERNRAQKIAKIENLLSKSPEIIKKHRDDLAAAKEKARLADPFKLKIGKF